MILRGNSVLYLRTYKYIYYLVITLYAPKQDVQMFVPTYIYNAFSSLIYNPTSKLHVEPKKSPGIEPQANRPE